MLEKRIMKLWKKEVMKHRLRIAISVILTIILIVRGLAYEAERYYECYRMPYTTGELIYNMIIDNIFLVIVIGLALVAVNYLIWKYSKDESYRKMESLEVSVRTEALFEYLDQHECAETIYKKQMGVQHWGFWVFQENPDMKLFVRRERDEFLYIWGENETGEEIWHTVEFPGDFFHYFTPIYPE